MDWAESCCSKEFPEIRALPFKEFPEIRSLGANFSRAAASGVGIWQLTVV
jgi:hypothetical protein